MRKTTVYWQLIWLAAWGWLFFLMRLSAETGTATHLTSMRLAVALVKLLDIPADRISSVNHALRMTAHGMVFFVLGGAVSSAVWATWPWRRYVFLPSLMVCNLLAIADEVKKLWIAGRHLSWAEAGLNCVGAAAGVLFALLCIRLAVRGPRRERRNAVNPEGGA